MRKIFLFMCAFVTATMAMAQDNLVQKPVGEGVTVTATASAWQNDDTAPGKAVDGNNGTFWGNYGTDDMANAWFQIEWSEAQTFNTIKMLCENGMNSLHSYKIQTSTTGEDGSWTDVATVEDAQTPGGSYEVVKLASPATTKYLRFQGTKVGTCYSFFEFEVYSVDYSNQVLASLTSSVAFVMSGEETAITLTAMDKDGVEIELSASDYTVENGTISDGKLTASASGLVTISATYGGETKTCTVYALGDDDAPAAPTNMNTAVYTADTHDKASWQNTYNEGSTKRSEIQLGDQYVTPFENVHCFFFGNSENGGWESTYAPTEKGIAKLHLSLFAKEACDIRVGFEIRGGSVNEYYAYSLVAGWNDVEVDLAGATQVGKMSVRSASGATVFPNLLVSNIYFTNAAADDAAPVFDELTVGAITENTVTLNMKATDEISATINYTITYGETTVATTGNSGEATTYTVEGLDVDTEYTFSVVAADLAGNKTEAKTVTVKTDKHYNFTVTEQTDDIFKLAGNVNTEDDMAKLNEALAVNTRTAFDLTELVLPETTTSLTVGNPNALVIVNKDAAESTGVKEAQLKGQRNLCVYSVDGNKTWMSPVAGTKYLITDGYPVFTDRFISITSNGAIGYEYTRKLTAGKYVTTFLPGAATLPEGVTAYTFSSQTDGVYTFTKVGKSLAAHTPYILYVEKDATIFCDAHEGGDLYLTANVEKSFSAGDLTFCGTYHTINCDGTQYAISNNSIDSGITLKPFGSGSFIGAFRAYFTTSAGAKDIKFVFSDTETTGINTIAAEKADAKMVYSLDGRMVSNKGVEGLAKGLYIIGGKKVIVK